MARRSETSGKRNYTEGTYTEGMIQLVSCDSKEEYLLYQEQFLKTFRGGLHEPKITPREGKIYKNEDPERCPINLFKKYVFTAYEWQM